MADRIREALMGRPMDQMASARLMPQGIAAKTKIEGLADLSQTTLNDLRDVNMAIADFILRLAPDIGPGEGMAKPSGSLPEPVSVGDRLTQNMNECNLEIERLRSLVQRLKLIA